MLLTSLFLVLSLGLGCGNPNGKPTPPDSVATQDKSQQPKSIGQATMRPDGTILLQLRAEADDGTIGDSLLEYPRGHKRYKMVLDHLGGLDPGQEKPVPPWP